MRSCPPLFTASAALARAPVAFRQPSLVIFSDDRITSAAGFLADDVALADVEKLEAQGIVGEANPPVYVKSVTYGRIVKNRVDLSVQAYAAPKLRPGEPYCYAP